MRIVLLLFFAICTSLSFSYDLKTLRDNQRVSFDTFSSKYKKRVHQITEMLSVFNESNRSVVSDPNCPIEIFKNPKYELYTGLGYEIYEVSVKKTWEKIHYTIRLSKDTSIPTHNYEDTETLIGVVEHNCCL